jgi:cytochrome c biogenesis factor
MNFERACIRFINFSARLFGGLALVSGIVFLVSAYAFEANRATYIVASIFVMGLGVAVFMAKRITTEDIARIRRRMGGPE